MGQRGNSLHLRRIDSATESLSMWDRPRGGSSGRYSSSKSRRCCPSSDSRDPDLERRFLDLLAGCLSVEHFRDGGMCPADGARFKWLSWFRNLRFVSSGLGGISVAGCDELFPGPDRQVRASHGLDKRRCQAGKRASADRAELGACRIPSIGLSADGIWLRTIAASPRGVWLLNFSRTKIRRPGSIPWEHDLKRSSHRQAIADTGGQSGARA